MHHNFCGKCTKQENKTEKNALVRNSEKNFFFKFTRLLYDSYLVIIINVLKLQWKKRDTKKNYLTKALVLLQQLALCEHYAP